MKRYIANFCLALRISFESVDWLNEWKSVRVHNVHGSFRFLSFGAFVIFSIWDSLSNRSFWKAIATVIAIAEATKNEFNGMQSKRNFYHLTLSFSIVSLNARTIILKRRRCQTSTKQINERTRETTWKKQIEGKDERDKSLKFESVKICFR